MLNIISMGTRKKIARVCTKGHEKGIKMFHYKKNQLNIKEDSNSGNEGQKKSIRHLENK